MDTQKSLRSILNWEYGLHHRENQRTQKEETVAGTIELLDKIGFIWNLNDYEWKENFDLFKKHVNENVITIFLYLTGF